MNYQSPHFQDTDEAPEYEARKVLAEIGWDGSLPIDLLHICDMYGLECIFSSDPSMREEGTTKFRSEDDFYIFINTNKTDCIDGFSYTQTKRRRQRFTLAHEIAHCIYKSHTNFSLQQELNNAHNPHRKYYEKKRENQANQFAAHLLIPREAFQKLSSRCGWSNISRLIQQTANEFDVSIEVAAQQTARLSDYPCISILFHLSGIPKRVPVYSDEFRETKLFYSKSQNAPEGTAAVQLLSQENQSVIVKKKEFPDATIWFPSASNWTAEKFSVTETSFRLSQYGIVAFLEICEID